MRKTNKIAFLFFLVVFSYGCAATHGSSTYSRQQMGRAATVTKGVIVSLRIVKISGTRSGFGAATGAAGGGIAGSTAGGGNAGTAAAVLGGVVVGGILGAAAEEGMTKTTATEFLIKEENGDLIAVVQKNDDNLAVGEKVLIMRMDKIRIVRDTLKE